MTNGTSAMPTQTTHTVAKAWWSLALLLPSVIAAFLVGESVPTSLGLDVRTDEPVPVWAMALALGAATLVLALPLLVTVHYSSRAAGAGVRTAWLPVVTGGAIVAGFVSINAAGGILILVTR